MADFKEALEITLLNEDGEDSKWFYTKGDKGDPGGETVHGISRNNWPEWSGWPLVDAQKDSLAFPQCLLSTKDINDLVQDFYLTEFWNMIRGTEINAQIIANQVFDSAVNQGTSTAVKLLQESINWVENTLKVDGKLGPMTLSVLNRFCYFKDNAHNILDRFLELRRAKYQALAVSRPAEAWVLPDWLSRCKV